MTPAAERAKAEEAGRESEARFRAIFESTRRLIGLLAPDGLILEENPAARAHALLTSEEVGHLRFWEGGWWLNDQERARIKEAIERANRGEYIRFETHERNAEGRILTIDFSITPVFDQNGKVKLLIVEGTDITAFKEAQAALAESEEFFRAAFEGSPVGFAIIGEGAICLDANSALCRMLGYEREELVGQSFLDLTPDDDPTRELPYVRALLKAGGGRAVFKKRFIRRDGEIVFGLTSLATVSAGRDGRPYRSFALIQDITELEKTKAALAASERLFRATFEQAPIGAAIIGVEGHYEEVNEALCQMLGYKREELIGKQVSMVTVPDDPTGDSFFMRDLLAAGGGRTRLMKRYVRRDGEIIEAQVDVAVVTPERDQAGRSLRNLSLVQDITRLKRTQAALATSEQFFRTAFQSAPIGFAILQPQEGRYLDVNEALCQMLGYSREELVGRLAMDVTAPDDPHRTPEAIFALLRAGGGRATMTKRYIRRDGQVVHALVNLALVGDIDDPRSYCLKQVQDMTERLHREAELYKAQEQLVVLARNDHLTGLANRWVLEEHIAQYLQTSHAADGSDYLLFIDLDHFKVVNDVCGYVAGDELLKGLAGLLRAHIQPDDLLARLGGDEFALLLHRSTEQQALAVAEEIIGLIQGYRFVHENRRFQVGASVGITRISPADLDVSVVMLRADRACHAAKTEGRGRHHIYRDNDIAIADARWTIDWAQRIRQGLEDDRFQLFLQRIVSADGQTRGYEALSRFLDDEGAPHQPGTFMSAAKRFGLMNRIDQRMFRKAIELVSGRAFREALDAGHYVSVNLAAKSIADPIFRDWLINTLDRQPLATRGLRIELIESDELRWTAAELEFLKALRARGLRLYLDDFGTGYNSFEVLKRIAVDGIKIDRSVVMDIASDPIDQALVSAALSIVRDLGIGLIAEGVEDRQTLEFLVKLGVSEFQGFLFHKPEPAELVVAANLAARRLTG